jgi:hypothetical protein
MSDWRWFFSLDRCDFCGEVVECICVFCTAACFDCAAEIFNHKKQEKPPTEKAEDKAEE